MYVCICMYVLENGGGEPSRAEPKTIQREDIHNLPPTCLAPWRHTRRGRSLESESVVRAPSHRLPSARSCPDSQGGREGLPPELRPENDTDEQNKDDNDSGGDDALLIHSNVGQMKGHRSLSDLKCAYGNKQAISLPSNHLLQGTRRTVYGGIGALELYTHLRQAS